MHFPLHRFAGYDYVLRSQIIDMWQAGMSARAKASRYRKAGWSRDASFWSGFAIERIKSVKHWAKKAEANV